jgi:hypothetical protein
MQELKTCTGPIMTFGEFEFFSVLADIDADIVEVLGERFGRENAAHVCLYKYFVAAFWLYLSEKFLLSQVAAEWLKKSLEAAVSQGESNHSAGRCWLHPERLLPSSPCRGSSLQVAKPPTVAYQSIEPSSTLLQGRKQGLVAQPEIEQACTTCMQRPTIA